MLSMVVWSWILSTAASMEVCTVSSEEPYTFAKEDNVERYTLVKLKRNANLPCDSESSPAANAYQLKNMEGLKGVAIQKPSMCAKCVACAAAVFSLIEEFEKGRPSKEDRNQPDWAEPNGLAVVCERKLLQYEIWDVDGIRYFGRKTLNGRQVPAYEPLRPAIEYVCEALRNSTSSSHLHQLWAQNGWKQLMTDVCFDPYNSYGLAACHRMLRKPTKPLGVAKTYCTSQYLTYLVDYYFARWRKPFSPSEIREHRLLCAWYTLGDRDVEE